jgi:hypothetical protein
MALIVGQLPLTLFPFWFMSVEQVVKSWLRGECATNNRNLSTDGVNLYHYRTMIGYTIGDTNGGRRYVYDYTAQGHYISQTTSKVVKLCSRLGARIVPPTFNPHQITVSHTMRGMSNRSALPMVVADSSLRIGRLGQALIEEAMKNSFEKQLANKMLDGITPLCIDDVLVEYEG